MLLTRSQVFETSSCDWTIVCYTTIVSRRLLASGAFRCEIGGAGGGERLKMSRDDVPLLNTSRIISSMLR